MGESVSNTLALATRFAEDQRGTFGDEWFFEFKSAIAREDLRTIHDLIIAGLQMQEGLSGTREILREVDQELAEEDRAGKYIH